MHDCICCGGACYCHGDIDDCQVETPQYSYMHCTGCGCSEDDFDHDFDGDFDPFEESDNACLYPQSCCMPGEHSPQECYTPEMLDDAFEEARHG